jgi:hypothetical protein
LIVIADASDPGLIRLGAGGGTSTALDGARALYSRTSRRSRPRAAEALK